MLVVDVEKRLGEFALTAKFEAADGATALFGSSGSGKTSIVNMIAGLIAPDRGRIALDGTVLFDSATRTNVPAHRRRIGYVFQEGRLFPHLTVAQNLDYGRWMSGVAADPAERERIVALLDIGHLMSRRPGKLSGGERQRVAFGRALLMQAAAPPARRAARLARPRPQTRNPAVSGAAARRSQSADDLRQPSGRRDHSPRLAGSADRGRPGAGGGRAGAAGRGVSALRRDMLRPCSRPPESSA